MRILTVVGARPQFVKVAVVHRAVEQWNETQPTTITTDILHTGQHFDPGMSQVFFDELGIATPGANLGIGGVSHGAAIGRMLEGTEDYILSTRPDAVVVYGDTNSTIAAALAACRAGVPVVHVEAGLRSFDKSMPEEQNRILTDSISTLLCCPTETAIRNLTREGIRFASDSESATLDHPTVIQCGDVMYDAVLMFADRARKNPTPALETPDLRHPDGTCRPFVLTTIHRAENTDDPARLESILKALRDTAENVPVIFPVHPRTRAVIDRHDPDLVRGITLIPPVSYLEMIGLLADCTAVCTDSGGLQKEAFFLSKPCVTVRTTTEWTETIDAGWNILTCSDAHATRTAIQTSLNFDPEHQQSPFEQRFPASQIAFGAGTAGQQIVQQMVRIITADSLG